MTLNIETKQQSYVSPRKGRINTSFKGPLDGAVTKALMTIDTNPMVNSAFVDVAAMVIPRTYIDTKERNKYAGFETFFREFTGTIIMCFSAGPVAYAVAGLYNRLKDKSIDISPNMWVTDASFDTLKTAWNKSDKNVSKYVDNIFSNISGLEGKKISNWKNIEWDKVEWFDNPGWEKIKWKNPEFKNIAKNTKNEEQIIKVLTDLIQDEKADSKDIKKVFDIVEHRIANALQVSKTVDVSIDGKNLTASLKNIIRDMHDVGKNIFIKNIDISRAEAKLKSANKVKTLGAIAIVACIGLGNQYINRYITKKRTGKDDFVGYQDFANNRNKINDKNGDKTKKARLIALKTIASAGILALSMGVMKIKNPAEFLKRLEFTGAITSGNATKTLYTATLIGRFLAARDENELRESCFRDYLGFLNWLVLGSFVSKGVAQLCFDKNQKNLFNVKEDGVKGIRKWLNNVSLKSHAEITSKGQEFAKKNIWKLNVAHAAGLLYSGIALGCALPIMNIIMTKRNTNKTDKTSFSNKTNYDVFAIFNNRKLTQQ